MAAARTVVFGPGVDEVYDVWEPTGPPVDATVALVHGGLWLAAYDRHQLDPASAVLARAGFHVANVEYTRVGMPGGGWPGTGASVLAGLRAVAADPQLPDLVVAVGHSAGGQLVMWAAAGRDAGIAGAVSLAGVLDLAAASSGPLGEAVGALLGGAVGDGAPAADADPARHRLAVPAVVVHGADDDLVPPEQSRRYVAGRGADEPSCRLILVEGCEHFGLVDPSHPAFATLLAAVRELAGLASL